MYDDARTDPTIKTICTDNTHGKWRVGAPQPGERAQTASSCRRVSIYVKMYIVSFGKAGTRKQTRGGRKRLVTLIHHRNIFREQDTTCTQGKTGVDVPRWCTQTPFGGQYHSFFMLQARIR